MEGKIIKYSIQRGIECKSVFLGPGCEFSAITTTLLLMNYSGPKLDPLRSPSIIFLRCCLRLLLSRLMFFISLLLRLTVFSTYKNKWLPSCLAIQMCCWSYTESDPVRLWRHNFKNMKLVVCRAQRIQLNKQLPHADKKRTMRMKHVGQSSYGLGFYHLKYRPKKALWL